MIPMDVATGAAPEVELEAYLRRALGEAQDALARAQHLEREARALPESPTTAETVRLLGERATLARRRVDLYTRTLAVVQHGLATT